MSQISTHLNLPYIQPAQAQKHVTHNEAIELLDMIVQLTVQDFDAIIPPAPPAQRHRPRIIADDNDRQDRGGHCRLQ